MVDKTVVAHFLEAMDPKLHDASALKAQSSAELPTKVSTRAQFLVTILLALAALSLTVAILRMANLQLASFASFQIQSEVQALKNHMLDTETGERGFVITNDAAFLEPYQAGQAAVSLEITHLATAMKDEFGTLTLLDHIKILWAAKLIKMETTIANRRAGRISDAVALVSEGRGKALMDEIRADMRAILVKVATRQQAGTRAFTRQQDWLVGLGLLVFGLALLIAGREFRRARWSRHRQASQQRQLESANADLTSRVDQGVRQIGSITALLDAVINTTNEAIYAKDKQSRMVFANEACLRIIGRPRAEVIGFTEQDYHPDSADTAAILANDRRILESGIGEMIEERYAAGGMPRVFLSSKAPMRNDQGEVIGVVGVSSDITARKNIEAKLFLSQRRFDAAISAFEGIVWTAGPHGGVLSVNAQWTKLTGLLETDSLGGGWRAAQHPDDIEATASQWKDCLRDVRPFIGEYRLRDRQGLYRTMLVRAVPVLDPLGNVAEWVGLNIDITDAREVELRHEAALTKLNIAMEAANTGAFEIVPGQIETSTFDSRVLEIWGQSEGATLEDLVRAVHPHDRAEVTGVFEGLNQLRGGDRVDMEYRILRPDGATRWVAIRAVVFAPTGTPLRLIGTVRDISLRREQQDRIQFLMRELAHRSKNSLAVVQAISRQTAKKSANLTAFQASFEARVQGMARSLDLLVKYDWTAVAITELIHSQLLPFVDDVAQRISVQGPNVYLMPEAAQNIGLALHELATNAAKYGALAADEGKIELVWGMSEERDGRAVFKLQWREQGGPPVTPPDSHGFGHVVIHRVVKAALAGESVLHFHEDGVQWELVIPAAFVSTQLIGGSN